MSFFSEWRIKLVERFGRAPAPGPVLLPTGTEDYPVAIQREIAGGTHGFDSVEEMVAMKRGLMTVPMMAIVPNEVYILRAMPPDGVERIADIEGYVLADYWIPLKNIMTAPTPDINQPDNGVDAWTWIPALVAVGSGVYIQTKDWIGGSGTKPEVGQFLGPDGFVNNVADATNLIALLQASLTLTCDFGFNGSGGLIAIGAIPRVGGPATLIHNRAGYKRSVLLMGSGVVRPDSSQEDTVRILLQKSVDGINDWQNIQDSNITTKINGTIQLSTQGHDDLNPNQKMYYRFFMETINGGSSHFPENPRIFYMMI
jgi:hypothetical protein